MMNEGRRRTDTELAEKVSHFLKLLNVSEPTAEFVSKVEVWARWQILRERWAAYVERSKAKDNQS